MVTQVEPRVEIDDRIRENPELLKAVTAATAFLGRQAGESEHPAALRWRPLPLDPNTIELELSDHIDFSDLVARRFFPVTELTDTYGRESGMLRAWATLLGIRSDKQKVRVDHFIQELNRVLREQSEEQTKAGG